MQNLSNTFPGATCTIHLFNCGREGECDLWWSSNNPECTIGGNNYFIGNEEPNLPINITFHIVKPTGEEANTETITSYRIFDCEPEIDPQVSSTSSQIGDTLSQPGWGFTPGGTAELHFRRPDGTESQLTPISYEQVGSDGTYNHSWTVTSDAQIGQYQYWAK